MADEVNAGARLLVHVRYAAAAVDECLHSLHDTVIKARRAGVSWAQIAETLGISRQEAEQQFAGRDADPG